MTHDPLPFLLSFARTAAILLTVLFVLRCMLPWLFPFVLGFAIAAALRPLTGWMCRYMKMRRRPASIFAALIFYLSLGALLWLLSVLILSQAGLLAEWLSSSLSTVLLPRLEQLGTRTAALLAHLSREMGDTAAGLLSALTGAFREAALSLPARAVELVTRFASRLPLWGLGAAFTVVSSIFICADYQQVAGFLLRQLSPVRRRQLLELKSFLTGSLLQMIRAYGILLILTFLELSAGLLLLRVPHALPLAGLIALLDILPVIGTGGVLIPWGCFCLLAGNTPLGVGLVFLWGLVTAVRSLLEPRIVGSQIGLHPLVTITAMFFGIRVLGAAGLLLGPLLALILKHLNETGAISLYKP